MLVVGIGYRLGALIDTVVIRTRDLTPTVDADYARLVPEQSEMGGAPRLLEFIRAELMPWVAARYNVEAAGAAYFGHSLGGLFGCYTLLHAPDTFHRYGISSPSLWWHFQMMFEREQAYAAAHDDLDARVFFAIGAFEDEAGRHREAERLSAELQALARARPIDMVADMARMVECLRGRGYPSLELESIVLPGEFHITVWPVCLSRSLRYLFDAPR
jgi:predicted alpha/beta superfamily hydrolase